MPKTNSPRPSKTGAGLRVVALSLALAALNSLASAQGSVHGTVEMQAEIEALKKEVLELRKAIEELRQSASTRVSSPAAQTAGPVTVGSLGKPAMGRPEAMVTIVEFSDYQCPFCRRHANTTLRELKSQYVDAGKVRYVFRDLPLDSIHPHARKAAEAAHCAGDQGRYWEMHDRLFSQRQFAESDLSDHAAELGLDGTRFGTCIETGKHAKAVREDAIDARAIGVTATPTFFIGRTRPDGTIVGQRLVGAQPIGTFRRAIDRLLE